MVNLMQIIIISTKHGVFSMKQNLSYLITISFISSKIIVNMLRKGKVNVVLWVPFVQVGMVNGTISLQRS